MSSSTKHIKDDRMGFETVNIAGEIFYKISDIDTMRPFFMSIVSDSNHWMFVWSNGGISCGRKNPDYALFPYYTDDKIKDSSENTGSKTILHIFKEEHHYLWEPFSIRGERDFQCKRNLYKSNFGNKIIFEEINTDLGVAFQYEWCTSNLYGFVKKCKLVNLSSDFLKIKLLDGLQNVLPYGVGNDLQTRTSNLADAYKRAELIPEVGLGIFALSAIIVDKAEPSEALKANVIWSLGLQNTMYLLSSSQLDKFRKNETLYQEEDVKGERGNYFVSCEIHLQPHQEMKWIFVANVNQTYSDIIQLSESIKTNSNLLENVLEDVQLGTTRLIELNSAADGLQYTADELSDTRHFSNVLFNIMRGGIFDNNYEIEKWDFTKYLKDANRIVFERLQTQLQQLGKTFSVFDLNKIAQESGDLDFIRLSKEYLPLKFSRRHGDPSRPWNMFSINTRSEVDGSKILDYQGNWRDIFQNWEALAHSYPFFIEGMIFKFLNASTFDGYNPYRVTKNGFDWEAVEPDNPWSYIGYWGDHQVIYLLKFLEFISNHQPDVLQKIFSKNEFVYANVPYKIKSYEDILYNSKSTIDFDHQAEKDIRQNMLQIGSDGALLKDMKHEVYHVNFVEKILATVLAKLSNFIPDGGIWMNTQRPEWNDANNALVGNGVSMVTLYYLRRFLKFFQPVFENISSEFEISTELHSFFISVLKTFENFSSYLNTSFSNADRKQMMDALGMAASNYRNQIYSNSFSGEKENLYSNQILRFINISLNFLEQSIDTNRRTDGLYHSYNLISYDEGSASISYLSEMLEGQVAALSSGYLSAEESLNVLDTLKKSILYRIDQNSYILYPNKKLPGFLQKNVLPEMAIEKSALLKQLINDNNNSIVEKDVNGRLHFNGNFRNAKDLEDALTVLDKKYQPFVSQEKSILFQIFEEVFNHKEFTGRSGTFFGYEGLGSIYWHMVSKLLLAVQETCLRSIDDKADEQVINKLVAHYYDIKEGIGVHKSPQQYGAFPTDPYSHTPFGKGAQQPGMTGQVKEDILTRFGELGVIVKEGKLHFDPVLLKRKEFIDERKTIEYIDINAETQTLALEKESLFFTYCCIPITYVISKNYGSKIEKADGSVESIDSSMLSEKNSFSVFNRTGKIKRITVFIKDSALI